MKNNGCVGCHQLGQLSTRTFPPGLGEFASHCEAWVRRTQAGQSGALMVNILAGQLAGSPIKYFADWTERIAKGELPKPNRKRAVVPITNNTPDSFGSVSAGRPWRRARSNRQSI